jgi:hypothetical protein
MIGLQLAQQQDIPFGSDFAFTYGPAGFLVNPLVVDAGTMRLGFAAVLATQVAIVLLALVGARRRLGWPLAIVLAWATASLVGMEVAERLVAVVFGLSALSLLGRIPATWLAAAGAIAGLALLEKFNGGLASVVILACAVAGASERRRALVAAAAGFVVAVPVLWLALGQSLGGLPGWLARSVELSSGYNDAMGFDPGPAAHWLYVAVPALCLLGLWAIAYGGEHGAARWWLALAWLTLSFLVWKMVVTRMGVERGVAMGLLAFGFLFLPWPRLSSPDVAWADRLLPALGSAAALLLTLACVADAPRALDPVQNARALGREGRLTVSAWRRERAVEAMRAAALRGERPGTALPPRYIRTIGRDPVRVEPSEISVIWAARLRWSPPPVMQSYLAYTATLDDADADHYRNLRRGPAWVLRQPGAAIDGRLPSWESPAAQLAMLCHFAHRGLKNEWQLLRRVPDRCGPSRELLVTHTRTGADVAVPTPPRGTVVVADIDGIDVEGLERLRSTLVRARMRFLDAAGRPPIRLVPGTARNGLIMRAARGVDYPAGAGVSPEIARFRLRVDGSGSRSVTIRWRVVSVGTARGGRAAV